METLEFGDLLMRRRSRLEALAAWLVDDARYVGPLVRRTLADTWRARDRLASEMDMDRFLDTHLRSAVRARVIEGSIGAGPPIA